MAKHVEREQTDHVTELTADEMECVSGGYLKIDLANVQISSISMGGGHEPPPPPPPTK
jgi:hypothetical protein